MFRFILVFCCFPAFLWAQTPKIPLKIAPKMPTDTLLSEADLAKKPTYTNIVSAYRNWEQVYRLQFKTSGSLYGKVTDIHWRIDSLVNLQYLYCSNEALSELPFALGSLRNMQQLYLSGNKIEILPDTIYQLRNLKRLDLANNQLMHISEKIVNFTQLELLYLHSNKKLKTLPVEQIAKLQNLRFLNIKGTSIPREQAQKIQKLLPKCKVEFD
jgi:hypothetical protein